MTSDNSTALSNFFQIAYVATDMDKAIEVFRETYGVPGFWLSKDVELEVGTPNGPSQMVIHLACAWLGETMFEIIQPLKGAVGHYLDYLPAQGFALVFHHLGFEVIGDHKDWLAFRNSLAAKQGLAIEGPREFPLQFVYVDNRSTSGHYHEYVWYGPGGREIWANVPHY